MPNDEPDALLTPKGREEKLRELEDRVDGIEAKRLARLENRVSVIEGKYAASDKRWDLIVKALVTIGGGIIIAVVSALIAGGTVHP